MKYKSWRFVTFLLCTLLINIFLLILITLNIDSIRTNGQWVNHTNEVKLELSDTLNALLNAETGQRGYILTGDEKFLDPYTKATPTIQDHLQRISLLTSNSPSQKLYLDDLKTMAAQRLELLKNGIAVRDTQGYPAVANFIRSKNGRQTMDALRTVVAEMNQYETIQYTIQQRTAEDSVDRLYLIGFLAIFTNCLFI